MLDKMGGTFGKIQLKMELISFYKDFLKEDLEHCKSNADYNNSIREWAQTLYDKACNAAIVLGKEFELPIDNLEYIGWDIPKFGEDVSELITRNQVERNLELLESI